MKKFTIQILLAATVFLNLGCAASYKPLRPGTLSYYNSETYEGIQFSYQYDVLLDRGNRKIARKERRRQIKVVAVKFVNTTDRTVVINRDFDIYADQNPIFPLSPVAVRTLLKQSVSSYLPYLLLTSLSIGDNNSGIHLGLIMGPGIAFGNMWAAGTSNKNMMMELLRYDINNREIKPGETLYGIVGMRSTENKHLYLKFKEGRK